MPLECHATLSGLHVPSLDGGRCRCGWVAPPLDLALLEAKRQALIEAAGQNVVRRMVA